MAHHGYIWNTLVRINEQVIANKCPNNLILLLNPLLSSVKLTTDINVSPATNQAPAYEKLVIRNSKAAALKIIPPPSNVDLV